MKKRGVPEKLRPDGSESGGEVMESLARGSGLSAADGTIPVPPPRPRNGGQFAIILLTLSAGIGGFLFGYDTGVISGALLYIRDDFPSVDESTELQEVIVSMAILGAAIGAAAGGHLNDKFGRKPSILMSDVVFGIGALVMAVAPGPVILIVGRVLVGLGVGIASMAVPLYIAETSPPAIRGALVSVNVLMITTGQFVSYVVNYAFTEVPGTWRWMLGVAAVPAVIQSVLLLFLPESPRWLLKQGRVEEARMATRKLNLPNSGEAEMADYVIQPKREERSGGDHHHPELSSLESDSGNVTSSCSRLKEMVSRKEMRLALTVGVGLQVFQQLVGINTVMYYSPSIVELAGFAAHHTALKLSMLVALTNMIGTVVGIFLIDKCGRRKLVLWSLAGVILALGILSISFKLTAKTSPGVQEGVGDLPLGPDFVCPATSMLMDCADCLGNGCGFCTAGRDVHEQMAAGGSCLVLNSTAASACTRASHSWYARRGCPSTFGFLALIGLVLYIMAFAPGMGPVPWAVNSEIYPIEWRGLANGVAATANWIANLLVAQTFLTLTRLLGTSLTFLILMFIGIAAFAFITFYLPETKGASMQQIQEMWEELARETLPSLSDGLTNGYGKLGGTTSNNVGSYERIRTDEEGANPGPH